MKGKRDYFSAWLPIAVPLTPIFLSTSVWIDHKCEYFLLFLPTRPPLPPCLSTVGVQHVFGDFSGLHTSPQRRSSRLVVCTANTATKKNGCWFAWVCSGKSSESPWCYKVIFSYISSLTDNNQEYFVSVLVQISESFQTIWIA